MDIKVVVFQTCKISEEITNKYINMPQHQLSKLLLGDVYAEDASNILYLISLSEQRTINYINKKIFGSKYNIRDGSCDSNPDNDILQCLNERSSSSIELFITCAKSPLGSRLALLTNTYDTNPFTKMGELYSRDEEVFTCDNDDQPLVFTILVNGIYHGHVYAWPRLYDNETQVMNIMGIRTSISRILLRQIERDSIQITPILLAAIDRYIMQNYAIITYMRVLSPFRVMQRLLQRYKFTICTFYESTNLKWLLEDGYVGNGPVTSDEETFDHTADYVHKSGEPLLYVVSYFDIVSL